MSLSGTNVKHTPELHFWTKNACSMPAASGSKVVTEIKGNKGELSFHLHGIYEGFASISKLMN